MPCSHSVLVPGFENILLVLVEDSHHSRSPHFRVPGVATSKAVYPGSRIGQVDERTFVQTYINDMTDVILAMSTNDTYVRSATLARAALRDMEVNISIDGAIRMAVSVAAELSSVANITPYLTVEDDLTSYDQNLSGAWTLGGERLSSTQFKTKNA